MMPPPTTTTFILADRVPATSVGGLLWARPGSVVAGTGSPASTVGGLLWVRPGSVETRLLGQRVQEATGGVRGRLGTEDGRDHGDPARPGGARLASALRSHSADRDHGDVHGARDALERRQ